MMFPDGFIQELKSRVDMVQLISEYTTRRRTGSDTWQGRCPFPNRHAAGDRNPSFVVYANGSFYCYGCGAGNKDATSLGSDCIAFMRMKHDLSFSEAVIELAQSVGMALPDDSVQAAITVRQRKLNTIATHIGKYNAFLKNDKIALGYLYNRGITDNDIDTWQLGLVSPRLGYMAISNRITFPIHDERGTPVGFGYRAIHGEEPKYRNSPDSEVFSKGNLLYGLHQARKAIMDSGKAYVTEGYMDVIAAHRVGVHNAVALMGTSFTDGQAKLLRRYTDELVLALDGDLAGQDRMVAHVTKAREHGFIVKIVQLDIERDLDDYACIMGANLGDWLQQSETTPSDWRLNSALSQYRAALHSLRERCLRDTKEIIQLIDNPLDKAEAYHRVAKELELPLLEIIDNER